jgi:DNA polymerase-3 subunit delta'
VPFDAILGQEPAVQTLRRALDSGRVHHAYRFEGPDGVGKELAAFALAEALICGPNETDGAGACRRRVRTLSEQEPRVPLHPDVLLVQRGLYRRLLSSSEATGIGIEQIRRIVLARVGYPPHEGRAVVCIMRDADELTVQAANALLKTLEEPAPHAYFVLLSSQPKRLPSTVLSRTLPLRFGPLPQGVVETILERHGMPTSVAAQAQGSASLALRLADAEGLHAREQFVDKLSEALSAPSLAAACTLVDLRGTDRQGLREQLSYLAAHFAATGRASVTTDIARTEQAARRHQAVLEAVRQLERNVQPALVLESMVARLRRA